MSQLEISFACDRMLGRLARMLRLLGYDTLYSPEMTTDELHAIAECGERVVLTRGQVEKRFPGLRSVLSLVGEHAPGQLREVVERFKLDTRAGLWTRCTLCNASIEAVEKPTVASLVPAKVFQVYDEFFQCIGCGHVYWRGSHVERVERNLATLLGNSRIGGTKCGG